MAFTKMLKKKKPFGAATDFKGKKDKKKGAVNTAPSDSFMTRFASSKRK